MKNLLFNIIVILTTACIGIKTEAYPWFLAFCAFPVLAFIFPKVKGLMHGIMGFLMIPGIFAAILDLRILPAKDDWFVVVMCCVVLYIFFLVMLFSDDDIKVYKPYIPLISFGLFVALHYWLRADNLDKHYYVFNTVLSSLMGVVSILMLMFSMFWFIKLIWDKNPIERLVSGNK